MDLPDPESLRCFLAAARLLNFRAASATVSLTPAALGKRIQQLERSLGVELFHRTTRKVALTEAGLALLPRAQRMIEEAEACVRAARGESGPSPLELVVGTRYELGLSWLLPMLGVLERELPHLTLNLYFSAGPDLELRVRTTEIDCAVTSHRVMDPRVDSIRLHTEDYVFVGKPKLLEKTPLDHPRQAYAHTLIDAHRHLPLFSYWRAAAKTQVEFGRVRSVGTIAAIHWLVLRGHGLAVLPRYLVQGDLDRGRLAVVLPKIEAQPDYFRLLYRTDDPRISQLQRIAQVMLTQPLK